MPATPELHRGRNRRFLTGNGCGTRTIAAHWISRLRRNKLRQAITWTQPAGNIGSIATAIAIMKAPALRHKLAAEQSGTRAVRDAVGGAVALLRGAVWPRLFHAVRPVSGLAIKVTGSGFDPARDE